MSALCVLLLALGAAAAPPRGGDTEAHCAAALSHGIVPPKARFDASVQLLLPNAGGASLGGNAMGAEGHRTSLTQCSFMDTHSGALGWNWTRGHTEPNCSCSPQCAPGSKKEKEVCTYPVACFYEFGCQGYHTNQKQNMDVLQSYTIGHNITFSWTDTKPADERAYRTRLIYDFFLHNKDPAGFLDGLTDEITIELNYNANFSLPCPPSFPTVPLVEDAVVLGDDRYDFVARSTDEPSGGVYCQMNTFRRRGGDSPSAAVPAQVDLLPFIRFVQNATRVPIGGWAHPAGGWVTSIGLINEIYDHTRGAVVFDQLPHITPVGKQSKRQ